MTPTASFPPIVRPDWLVSRLAHDPKLRVLDGTYPVAAQRGDHPNEPAGIPGAFIFDIDKVADLTHPLPHTLPSAQVMQNAVRAMGIGVDTPVVVFDRKGMYSAARVWWMFRVFGHQSVAVLDGGLPAYLRFKEGMAKENIPLASPQDPSQPFVARLDASRVLDLEQMRELTQQGSACILDARSVGRFRGEQEEPRPGMRSGHMPGAVNLPYTELLDEQGCFLPRDALREALERALAAVSPPAVVGCTCGSGVTACILALAYEYCFDQPAAVYDGSWTEWGGRDDTPVVQGS